MAHGIFQRLTGSEGSVKIPALGIHVGDMQSWTLTRRGDGGPNEGLYDLRAVFSFINHAMFNHERYSAGREVRVRVSRKLEYRIEQVGNGRVALDGQVLMMEGVKLCQ